MSEQCKPGEHKFGPDDNCTVCGYVRDITNPLDNPIAKEAIQTHGAVPDKTGEVYKRARSLKDIQQDLKIKFFPELPRVKFEDLQGKEFCIVAVKIVQDWNSEFGQSDFPLLLVEHEDGTRATTAGSGKAILNQVKRFIKNKSIPVKVTLTTKVSENGTSQYNLFV